MPMPKITIPLALAVSVLITILSFTLPKAMEAGKWQYRIETLEKAQIDQKVFNERLLEKNEKMLEQLIEIKTEIKSWK